jgi:enoyl-CoA hydratase/carnithine racemase
MTFVHLDIHEGVATVRLERGKVNALNEQVVDELSTCLRGLETDPAVRGVLLTGTGSSSPSASTSLSYSTHRRRSSPATFADSRRCIASSSSIPDRWWSR